MGRTEKKKKSGGCCGWILIFVVIGGIALAIYVMKNGVASIIDPPGAVSRRYATALKIAIQFFDVQKSGKLEKNNITWRGDSGLNDGKEAKLDLSKGMYDAGDHIKFGFPLAFTGTVLSWGILEYGVQMKMVDELEAAKGSLKWITDYLINAHPTDNVLYIQVGDPEVDHDCWNRPEDMTEPRTLTQLNTSAHGTEVAAETAAALASASLVFKSTDAAYSTQLLNHAKKLFAFADKYRGFYSVSIPQLKKYYNSTGYGDELLWAAGWLYHATMEKSYFDYVTGKESEEFGDWGRPTWLSWDNKLAAAQVLMSRVSFFGSKDVSNSDIILKYRESAEAVMCNLLPKSPLATSDRTKSGLIWVSEWNSLQTPVASAFLAVLYSDYMRASPSYVLSCKETQFTASDLRDFAISQADYVLGKNPEKMSYLVGFGEKYPKYVHHRGASIPSDESPACKEGFKWLNSAEPNPNIAMGALVCGPFLNETFIDSRNNSMQTEPTTYNTALVVALLSGLLIPAAPVLPTFA